MASKHHEYSVEEEVAAFFAQAFATRSDCDLRANDLVGGDVVPVPVQGVCSYTVYAGLDASSVVQFRLKSLAVPLATVELARRVYGSLVPQIRFEGQLGGDETGKEVLCVYVMSRVRGISRLDFILASGFPEDSLDVCAKRLTLVTDVARFFALSWKTQITPNHVQLENLHQGYEKDLKLLQRTLPQRFQPSVLRCLDALPSIMALPTVLAHKDFGDSNILVDSDTCHLLGVIDWAEAKIEPFGINLYSVENLMGKFHLRNGFTRYVNYDILHTTFWNTLRDEVGGWSETTVAAIRSAMVLGLLRSWGFTSRLANMPEPVPISDDESGAYNMLHLHGLLVDPVTKFI